MRRTHVPHLRAAASQFLAKYSSSTSSHPLTVTAEIAEAVSSRSSRLTRLPSDVAEAIDAAAADSNRKAIRLKGRELNDELKRISRTKHRGGKYPNLHDTTPEYSVVRTLRGKRRQKENKALTELAQQHTPLAIEEHEPLPDSFWDGEERGVTKLLNAITNEAKESATANAAADGAMYQEDTAAAYAVTRFPACYAGLKRAFLEVQRTAPRGWIPESILDFGAGPGTATWAAHSIWSPAVREGGRPLQVTAVEPSGAMAWLGQDIQQRLEEAYQKQQDGEGMHPLKSLAKLPILETEKVEENEIPLPQPPMVRWMSRLSGSRGKRNAKEKKTATYFSSKKYDLVVAGYVLSEIPTPKDRRKLITDLWNRTGQYLILVEPGTPVGSDMIQLARSQILGLSSSSEKKSSSSFDSSSGKESSNTTLAGGAVHSEAAAHVVAPCPHDGPCPLKQGSRASWCHFIQRFERTAVQRRVKMVKGKLPPRSHQDERFSYIVLKRGPRGGGSDIDDREGDGDVFKEQVGVVGSFEKENGVQENDEEESEFLNIPENLKPKRVLLEHDHLYSETDDEDDDDLLSETEEETFGDEVGADNEVDDDDDLEATERELRRLLLDSISNDNNSDDSDTDEENANDLPPELEQVLQQSLDELRQNNKNRLDKRRNNNVGSEKEKEEQYAREEKEEEEDGFALQKTIEKKALTKGLSGPEAEEAARRSSSAWSRIIRPARKRSGHVVLDLCSAVGADGEPLDTTHESSTARPQGMLLRQIVSKGKANREIGGIAPFKLARRAAWGDLWPLDYQRKMKSFEPPTGGSSGDGDASGDDVE